jgi:hypothetical protein
MHLTHRLIMLNILEVHEPTEFILSLHYSRICFVGHTGRQLTEREQLVLNKLFLFVVLPSSTYLFTGGVAGSYFHLITLKYTTQSVGFLWTRDRPVAETST